MAALILPSRRVFQPQGPVEINLANPIARKLRYIGYPGAFGASANIAGAKFSANRYGLGVSAASANSGGLLTPSIQVGTKGTIFIEIFSPSGLSSGQYLYDGEGSSSRDIFYKKSSGGFGWYIGGSLVADDDVSIPASTVIAGESNRLILRWDETGASIWRNGKIINGFAISPGAASNRKIRIASRFSSEEGLSEGAINCFAVFDSLLTDREIEETTSKSGEFWSVLIPIQRRIMVAVGGGATNYTLTADVGAYTLTGESATTSRGVRMTGDVGSYALTGQAATTSRGYSLTGETGVYSLDGGAATFDFLVEGVQLLGGGPGLPRKKRRVVRTDLDKDSYLYRLLSPELRHEVPPEVAEVIEEQAAQAVEQPKKSAQAKKDLRSALKDEGIAYREAYREALTLAIQEMQRQDDEEEEAIAVALASLI